MKNSQIVAIVLILIVVIGAIVLLPGKKSANTPAPIGEEQSSSILGCYAAINGNDRYTLRIASQNGTAVTGTLEFKNYEKDSSSGLFTGTYENGILLGNYAFQSEGMNSQMQVIFKNSANAFVRGYGPVNTEGTRFTDLNQISYDASSPLAVFKKGECAASVVITSPKAGETIAPGQALTLTWTGGEDSLSIFLVDRSLKSAGASVAISDRVYSIKNTGTYTYTIPARTKVGEYEFQIGTSTSKPFMVVSR